jgi:hypothetical protein
MGAHNQPCWCEYITNVTRGMESSKQRQTSCRYVSENETRSGHRIHRPKSSVNIELGQHLVVILIYFIPLKCNIRRTDTSGGFETRLKTTSTVAV